MLISLRIVINNHAKGSGTYYFFLFTILSWFYYEQE
jgi:hypothetical protein